MLLFWLCFINGQVLPDTLGAGLLLPDTSRRDSLLSDSLAADTLPVIYPIPDIVYYGGRGTEINTVDGLHPRVYDLFVRELLPAAGLLDQHGRLTGRGRTAPARSQWSLNSRRMDNRINGSGDIRLLPLPFIETAVIADGEADLRTQVNRYDRPYSHLRFTTLGSTTMYNLDLTRAVSADAGFYLSGVYSRQNEAVTDSDETRNAFYASSYTGHPVSSRLDLLYSDRRLPGREKSTLYDAAVILGRKIVQARFSYRAARDEYVNRYQVNPGVTVHNRIEQIRMDAQGRPGFSPFILEWELWFKTDRVRTRSIFSDGLTDRAWRSGAGLMGIRSLGNFRFTLTGRAETDFQGGWFPDPGLRVGFAPFDSQEIFVSLRRTFQQATLSEKYGLDQVYDPEYPQLGNLALQDEYSWNAELGYVKQGMKIIVYQSEVRNYIKYQPFLSGLDSFYAASNLSRATIRGLDLALNLSLGWGFCLDAAGAYYFSHQDELCPDYHMLGGLRWQAAQGRARYEVAGWSRYLGPRYGRPEGDTRPVLSAATAIRFIALTASARLENIFGDEIADFDTPPRNFRLTIQWEFWN